MNPHALKLTLRGFLEKTLPTTSELNAHDKITAINLLLVYCRTEGITIDLVGANFRYKNLSEVDLTKANLTGADLSRANLSGAIGLNRLESNLGVIISSTTEIGADAPLWLKETLKVAKAPGGTGHAVWGEVEARQCQGDGTLPPFRMPRKPAIAAAGVTQAPPSHPTPPAKPPLVIT